MTSLHHVQLAIPAGGEEEARRFYCGVLGLIEQGKPEAMQATGGVWFAEGLHLGVEHPFTPARKAHPGFSVDDLDAVAERVAAAGGEVTWDARWPGVRRFHTADPFGNRIELLQGVTTGSAPAATPR
ncbi:MAG TPA: VOC family protein [Gaiellales bacterium]|nr:VOC family protein [Gaiellales bacterium]